MKVHISQTPEVLGMAAALQVQALIQKAVDEKGFARVLFSTGASQFTTFEALLKLTIPWEKVEAFHLDEYIGIDETHGASFIRYLKERFSSKVNLKSFHYVDPSFGIESCITKLTKEICEMPIDIGLIGIGNNGHIAFNDPPADFQTKASYHVVNLDHACRLQQMGEGWFLTLDEVPKQAISMTVYQILQCKSIISCVPYLVKAQAISQLFKAPKLDPMLPATALLNHSELTIYLDNDSASLLDREGEV
jgi:glucosamine-6-phosphate deaminase